MPGDNHLTAMTLGLDAVSGGVEVWQWFIVVHGRYWFDANWGGIAVGK